VLDILVQRRRNKHAAKKFFRKLLKSCQYVPRVVITDKLKLWRRQAGAPAQGGASSAPLPQQPCGELVPAHAPAGAAYAGVQVTRAGAAIPRRVWTYCPTLSTAPASLVRARVPSSNAHKMPGVGRDHGHRDSCLRVKSVCSWSDLALLLSLNAMSTIKLSTPAGVLYPDVCALPGAPHVEPCLGPCTGLSTQSLHGGALHEHVWCSPLTCHQFILRGLPLRMRRPSSPRQTHGVKVLSA
jgi:hypothetical protein